MFGPNLTFNTPDGHRLRLAAIEPGDTEHFIGGESGGMRSRIVTRTLGRSQGFTLKDEEEWQEKQRTDKTTCTWGIWIHEGGQWKIIGTSSLHYMDRGHIATAESGSLIFDPSYWRMGIAKHCHMVRTWYAFTVLGLHQITSGVILSNVASQKALERSGYRVTHTQRNIGFSEGRPVHCNKLLCLSPLEQMWDYWWAGDQPDGESIAARTRSQTALDWAESVIKL